MTFEAIGLEVIIMEDRYLKAKEVSKMLRISVRTLYKLVRDKKFPAKKIGNQYRFDSQDVASHMQMQMQMQKEGDAA